jgi:hypothetical protein
VAEARVREVGKISDELQARTFGMPREITVPDGN